MGRAIVCNPKVFLFDEPLSNLDAKLRVQMRSEIKDLHRRLGTTIVYVTHDQIEVHGVEPTGSEVTVNGRIGSQQLFCLFRQRRDAAPGDAMRMGFAADHVHLFDATTGAGL